MDTYILLHQTYSVFLLLIQYHGFGDPQYSQKAPVFVAPHAHTHVSPEVCCGAF